MARPAPERAPARGIASRGQAAWRAMAGEQRLAALAAAGLFATMFLPWYEKSYVPKGATTFVKDSVSAFGAFSFVEAAVLLVAAGALALVFARAEARAFHLPGGDGSVLFFGGLWAVGLLVWRLFDKPDVAETAAGAGTIGIQWGIFFAIAAGALLAYAGSRLRSARLPEPPIERDAPAPRSPLASPREPGAPPVTEPPPSAATRVLPRRRRRASADPGPRLFPVEDGEQHVPTLFPPPEQLEDPPPPPDDLEHRPRGR